MEYPSEYDLGEVRAWDVLVEYLVKKHSAEESSIQRYTYVDENKNGTRFLISDNPNESPILLCKNNNNNLMGSILYGDKSYKNEDFSLKKICKHLEREYPPLHNIEQLENKTQNHVDEQINEEVIDNINSAITASVFAFEYSQAKINKDHIFHLGQRFFSIDQFGFIKHKNIQKIKNIEVITTIPVNHNNLINFIKCNKAICTAFNVSADELIDRIKNPKFNIQEYIDNESKQIGFPLIPLFDLNNELISAFGYATMQNESETQSNIIKDITALKGSWHINNQADDNLYFLTEDIFVADSLATLLPQNKIYCSITIKNTIQEIENILKKNPDSIIVIALENIYSKALDIGLTNTQDTSIQGTLFTHIINYLIKNHEISKSIVFLMPEFISKENNLLDLTEFNFSELLKEFGENKAKNYLLKEINSAIDRRNNNQNELVFRLSEYTQFMNDFKEAYRIELPDLFKDQSILSSKKTEHKEEYIMMNPILADGYKVDYRELFSNTNNSTHLTESEIEFNEKEANFYANLKNLDI